MPNIKNQIANRITETFRTVFIDTLSIGLDTKSSRERINRLKKDYPGIPLDVLADRKILTQSRITAAEGAVSGAAISGIEGSYAAAVTAATAGSGGSGGPVVAGPALAPTLTAIGGVVTTEVAVTTRAQMKLIVDLAEIYNCPYDTKNDEDAWFIFKSALDITTFDFTLRSIQTAMNLEGRRLFIKLLQYKLIRRRFQKFVARTAGPQIARLLAQKYLAKIAAPVINIAIGGYANNRFTKRIGKVAKKKAKIRSAIYKEMNENLKISSDERVLFLSIMIQLANLSNYFSDNFMGLYNITAKHIKSTKKCAPNTSTQYKDVHQCHQYPFLSSTHSQ